VATSKKLGQLLYAHQRPLARVKGLKQDKRTAPEDIKIRKVSIQQLTLLMYFYYIGVTDPDIYYEDADVSPEQFQKQLAQEVDIDQEVLEKLLWYMTMCHESGRYWHPEQVEYQTFVRSMLEKEEGFDQLLCRILDKKRKTRRGGVI